MGFFDPIPKNAEQEARELVAALGTTSSAVLDLAEQHARTTLSGRQLEIVLLQIDALRGKPQGAPPRKCDCPARGELGSHDKGCSIYAER